MRCPILLENKVCLPSLKQKFHQSILQHKKLRFTVDRCSFKKQRYIHILFRYGAEHLHLRWISHMLLYCMRMFSSSYAFVVFVDFASYVGGCFVTKHKSVIKSVFFQHRLHLGTKVFANWFVGVFQMLEQMQFTRYPMQVFSHHSTNGCWRHLKFKTSSSDLLPGAPLKGVSNSFDRFSWRWCSNFSSGAQTSFLLKFCVPFLYDKLVWWLL